MTSPYRSFWIFFFFLCCCYKCDYGRVSNVSFKPMVYFNYLLSREGNLNEYSNEKYAAGWICDVTL